MSLMLATVSFSITWPAFGRCGGNAYSCPLPDLQRIPLDLWHVAGNAFDDVLIAATQLDDVAIRIADEDPKPDHCHRS